ncbi:MAG: hypothetical protein DDT32_00387 [Syntrophomonadaceae bacterium]|nr:hypothetical protein [Bacillota bacterium]
MKIAVHISHESAKKIGGIGAVLNGMCTAEAYKKFFDKTVLYAPLFEPGGDIFSHLGEGAEVLFSSRDAHDAGNYEQLFGEITRKYHIEIVYGRRKLVSEFEAERQTSAHLFLVGINTISDVELAKFKYRLWEKFRIQSDIYKGNWDYEQYLRIAIPFLEILEGFYGTGAEYYHFAHEYMGIPCALSVLLEGKKHKTIFVAHEVSTARFLVESHPGHDISFYNLLQKEPGEKSLEGVFGSHKGNPRNELIKRAVSFDRIFAVSDLVRNEYLFLVPDTPPEKIRTVYNGLSAKGITIDEKKEIRQKIQNYLRTLLNFTPDVILTHVTRLVISKGIWRDISLLYNLDEIFHSYNLKGAYILLSTLIATGRPPEDILRMEKDYGWPLLHKEGWPDLVGMETEIYHYLQLFNSRSKAIRGIFINQFGFGKRICGQRVPEDTTFADLRMASDAEMGFSIYEPFGIAQLETVPFGGVALLSSSCGSAFWLENIFRDAEIKPFYVVDFIESGRGMGYEQLRALTKKQRNTIERETFSSRAKEIFDIIPTTERKREEYLANIPDYISPMSWETVVKKYLLANLPT